MVMVVAGRVIIACGHLTNMQGCHGSCNGGLYVCAEYHD